MFRLKKINPKPYLYQTIILIISVVLCELGIGCYYTARLGTDPISVFVEGISFHCSLTVGQISTVWNVIFTILLFFFERKELGLGTIVNVLIAGPLIDLFCALLGAWCDPETGSMAVRVFLLLAGLLIYALGLGLGIALDLGVGPFSFPTMFLADYTPIDIKYTQVISDGAFFLIGLCLGGIVGVGTIVSVGLTGPLMELFLKRFEPKIKAKGNIFIE